jgi:hypothetical protein
VVGWGVRPEGAGRQATGESVDVGCFGSDEAAGSRTQRGSRAISLSPTTLSNIRLTKSPPNSPTMSYTLPEVRQT